MDAKKTKQNLEQEIKQKLEQGRNLALKQLNELRAEISSIDDELHWLDNAPLPLADALAAIDKSIKSHAADSSRVKPFFFQHGLAGLQPFEAKVEFHESPIVESGRVFGSAVADLATVLIPLLGANLRRTLHDLAEREAKNIESGPPLAERPELKASLLKRRYELEVEEESLICSCEDLYADSFYRRHDVNPEIVLMMETD